MTQEDKELIAGYMGLIFNPARLSCYQYEDGREFKFNSNDASRCVKEMQKRGDWEYFVGDTEDTLIYNIRYHKEHHSYKSFLVAWLFNSENFFAAMSEWLKRKGNEIQMANEE